MKLHTLVAAFVLVPTAARAQDQILQTSFKGSAASHGVMFSLTCVNAEGLYISWFEVGCPMPEPQSWIDVLTRPGTYVGHENTSEGWVYTAQGYYQCGTGHYPMFTLNYRYLEPGQVLGVYIQSFSPAGMEYSPIPPAAPEYSDANLKLSGGAAKLGFGFASATQAQSMWNGAIHYRTSSPPCYANCDRSTTPPYLDASDFVCFFDMYFTLPSVGNCDRSTGSPILNANDFICFMNAFAAGCTAP